MLKKCKIDPLSTYDRELPKFIADQRVSLVPKQLRREAFEKYCRENEARAIETRESVKEKVSEEFREWAGVLLSTQQEFLDFDAFKIEKRKEPAFLNALYELNASELKQIYQTEVGREKKKSKKE